MLNKSYILALMVLWMPMAHAAENHLALDALSPTQIKQLRKQLFGGLDVSFSGLVRIEGTSEHHFDLGSNPVADNSFYDLRAWIASRISKGPAALHLAVNIAGNDFSDPEGGILGNGFDNTATAGGPSVVRQKGFDLRIRHLFLSYDGFVQASAGRLPASIGNGITIHTIRDAAKLGKKFGKMNITAVLVKGGETQPNNDLNAASDNDLDAYGLISTWKFLPHHKVQLAIMKQVDSSFDDRLPEKLLIDLNANVHRGSWSSAMEFAWLGGHTPRDAVLGRRKNRAWMFYTKETYHLESDRASISIALGGGSGDNTKTEKQHDFQSFFMNSNGFHLTNIYGNDIHSYDAFLPGVNGDGNTAGAGFANTEFIQLSGMLAPFTAFPDSTIEAVFTYMRATRKQRVGDGVLLTGSDGFVAPAGTTETSHNIGWEGDINIDHLLTDGMHLYLHSGLFKPGAIFGSKRRTAIKLQGGVSFTL